MRFDIIAFVLAIVVPTVAGLVLHIFAIQERQKLRETFLERLRSITARLEACESGLKQTSSAQVAVDLAALAGDVENLAKIVRKNFGRVFAELHHDGLLDRNRESQADVETPDEVRARLRVKHGLPRIGGAAAPAADAE